MSSFVHLHVHSEYSLLDGACRIDALCRRSVEHGAPAIALTDHGVMFGAMEFYYAAKSHGITPIIGCEAYIAPRGRFDRTVRDEAHVTLLASDFDGYRNLVALVSKGFLEGYYYKPRIDLDLLAEHQAGLIVLSGCMSSLCSAPLLRADYASAKKAAQTFVDIFGDRFYLEIMRHGLPEEEAVNKGLISLARELSIPLVATNDTHYLECTDAGAHDVLLCIGTQRQVSDTNRLRFGTEEFYVKSADEMRELFADLPEACDNTLAIAKRVDIKIPEKVFHLPDYPVPVERTPDEYLRDLCEKGLVERYGSERLAADSGLRERLDYELSVIARMGYASYFLIVWDFIKYARDHGIPVGPGRGSAAGSLVSYCLSITTLDPIRHNLIFERFLNPDRISMPDIDTDFCVERRDEVIRYVTDKYGADRVAQIVTFGTMAARAAVRDAGRALGVPLPDVDRVAKLIPSGPGGLTIEQALTSIPELRTLYDSSAQIHGLLDTARTIEGLARHASTHAAGVVISKGPIIEHAPLIKLGEGETNTQYDMGWVEKIGLLKMDFLGLRNLTVMKNASDEIRRTVDPQFNLDYIRDDDTKTFEMLGRGDTVGVFQLESEGMKRVVTELQPSSFDDIVAINALYRPGPMEWIPHYIARKHGREKVTYVHPRLEPILKDTYGIAIYQESVMQMAREIAGFSMGEADELRKVMGKKLKDQVPIYREKFLAGAERCGVERAVANEIFTFIEPFAGYGFPKAHAVAYGWIAYQTAYLKANYPLQYLSALMTSVKDKTDKLVEYIDEARKLGLVVLPPNVNESFVDFATVGSSQIRFGLAAIKGVGEAAVWAILEARERDGRFTDLFDFAKRLDPKQANRRVLEALVKSGAMDGLAGNRAQLLDAIDAALDLATAVSRERELGQVSLFGESSAGEVITPKLRALPAPSSNETLAWERETLGIFLSGHPLADVAEALYRGGAIPIREARTRSDEENVTVAGLLTHVRRTLTRAQSQMLVATLEDMTGSIECILFPKLYEDLQASFVQDRIVIVTGRVRVRERPGKPVGPEAPMETSLHVAAAAPFTRTSGEPRPPGWHLTAGRREQIDALADLCAEFPGPVPLVLHVGAESRLMQRGITASSSVRKELDRIFGSVNVRESPP